MDLDNQIIQGDCFDLIREVPDGSIQLVITSPPYWQQRDYGSPDEVGRESSLETYLDRLLTLFRECLRVISDEGSVIFNLGDKYENANLKLIPYRFAILVSDRTNARLLNNITWVKPNPTPRQFQRRLVQSTEPFFHFVKSSHYHYDPASLDLVRDEPSKPTENIGKNYYALIERSALGESEKASAREALDGVIAEVRRGELASFRMKIRGVHALPFGGQPGGRLTQIRKNGFTIVRMPGNPMRRDVFEFPVETLRGNHHPAVYPLGLVERFVRLTTRDGDRVLDPFMGSGTTGLASLACGRKYLGFELNPEYVHESRRRVADFATKTLDAFGDMG
jgi:site-specific DNA-methyltransferase (adenine-specific)